MRCDENGNLDVKTKLVYDTFTEADDLHKLPFHVQDAASIVMDRTGRDCFNIISIRDVLIDYEAPEEERLDVLDPIYFALVENLFTTHLKSFDSTDIILYRIGTNYEAQDNIKSEAAFYTYVAAMAKEVERLGFRNINSICNLENSSVFVYRNDGATPVIMDAVIQETIGLDRFMKTTGLDEYDPNEEEI